MKITNKYNLPSPIYNAIVNDDYDDGGADITASSLWKPTQMLDLTDKHKEDIEVDASDFLGTLLGKALHDYIRKYDTEAQTEQRLFTHVEGMLLSGQFDRLIVSKGIIQDYKVTSVARFNHQKHESEWENQLNTYAFLLRKHGVDIRALQIVAILRDWSDFSAERNLDYPNIMVQVVDIPLWTPEDAEHRISERVNAHKVPAPCTDEERWYRRPKFAVMKNGRKNAIKLFEDEAEALSFIANATDSRLLYLQRRPGDSLRCRKYCSAAPFCPQWQADDTRTAIPEE
jgi:hypothetical protein